VDKLKVDLGNKCTTTNPRIDSLFWGTRIGPDHELEVMEHPNNALMNSILQAEPRVAVWGPLNANAYRHVDIYAEVPWETVRDLFSKRVDLAVYHGTVLSILDGQNYLLDCSGMRDYHNRFIVTEGQVLYDKNSFFITRNGRQTPTMSTTSTTCKGCDGSGFYKGLFVLEKCEICNG